MILAGRYSLVFSCLDLADIDRILDFKHQNTRQSLRAKRELEELLETCRSFGDWPRCASDAFKQFQVPEGLGTKVTELKPVATLSGPIHPGFAFGEPLC